MRNRPRMWTGFCHFRAVVCKVRHNFKLITKIEGNRNEKSTYAIKEGLFWRAIIFPICYKC